MKKLVSLLLIFLFMSALAEPNITLSHTAAEKIGYKIWQNEARQQVKYLTWWNKGENFASVGIGHFIWYPDGVNGIFFAMFTHYLQFARQHGAILPKWLRSIPACPWHNRAEFMQAQQTERMQQLRSFLVNTIDLQIQFMIKNLNQSIPSMLNAAHARKHVQQQLEFLIATPRGAYVLVDYANFKGLGLYAAERYHGQGWGLLQVLEKMHATKSGPAALQAFRVSATHLLTQRVHNAPTERHEAKWLPGWLTRVKTYR
jgi:hypothetical protein